MFEEQTDSVTSSKYKTLAVSEKITSMRRTVVRRETHRLLLTVIPTLLILTVVSFILGRNSKYSL